MDVFSAPELQAIVGLVAPVVVVVSIVLVGRWVAAAGDGARRGSRLRWTAIVLAALVGVVLLVGEVLLAIDVSGGEKPSALLIRTGPIDRLVVDSFTLAGWVLLAVWIAGGLFLLVLLCSHAFAWQRRHRARAASPWHPAV